ncbi:MAG: hypothetical protein OQK82_01205 [Candidatus Pacearchaeota archaeon]|nr:hypothetical protein [Candidatus Pacearchaeota archaeon]
MIDFSNIESVRIYRTYDGWNELSVQARALFLLVAQDLDPEGFSPKGLLVSTAMSFNCINAISELVQAGYLEISNKGTPRYRCPWWKKSQKATMSNTLRSKVFRRKKKALRRTDEA